MEKYKYIQNALTKQNCEELIKYIQKSVENGTTVYDNQVQNAYSVKGGPVLEKILEDLTPRMEIETGKKLYPTYAYARLYQKGSELHCHVDRDPCEYSATITLGYAKHNWPLFISEHGEETDLGRYNIRGELCRVKNLKKFDINIGDALLYKGCDHPHWREKLKGQWHAQIFLHYVDQDGKNSKYKYDKRPSLSHKEEITNPDSVEQLYYYAKNAISQSSCQQMIEKFEQCDLTQAEVGDNIDGIVDTKIRDVNKLEIPCEIGIGATLTGIGLNMNNRAWNFDVTHSNQSEFLKYNEEGHYKSHVDALIVPTDSHTRKLTIIAFLNDDFVGGNFYIENGGERFFPEQEPGTVIVFPSFIRHGVEPVKSGTRRCIVTWLVGPWFK